MTYKDTIQKIEEGGEIRYMVTEGNAKYFLHLFDPEKGTYNEFLKIDNRIINLIIKNYICGYLAKDKIGSTEFGKLVVKL
jgi:hypothetical protein